MSYLQRVLSCLISLFIISVVSVHADNPSKSYIKDGNSVSFIINNAHLKINVLDSTTMQVRYTLADNFSSKNSLIIEKKQWSNISFDIAEENDLVNISTGKLKVFVNKRTGELAFYDSKGSLLLKEIAGGGKLILPDNYNGVETNTVQQQFETSPNEAIYGLGQHHDRLLNIKGYDLDLFQYNTEVYVPFLVSSKGYGLLWHNYSHTKFGNPDAIQSIPTEQLYDENGKQGGLTLTAFSDSLFNQSIKVDSLDASSTLTIGKDTPIESAKLTGSIIANKTGEHLLYSYADGTFKVWINDELILDNWAPYANARDMGRVVLEKGKKYKINIEWSKYYPKNSFSLKWREPIKEEGANKISLWSRAGEEINYYIFAGDSMDEVIAGYRNATGTAPLMPKYAMGFWQSRERYKTQQELLDVVKEFRKREIPLDVIIQDWQYWKDGAWGSHLFDEDRFPNVESMIDELHNQLHTKFMISVWGKFYPGSQTFNELNDAGYLFQKPLQDTLRDFLDNKYTYYDAFNPKARNLYWKQMNENLFSKGVDAWWLDATEPELPDYGPSPDLIANYMNPTYEGPGVENLNAYPLMTCKGIFEGQRETNPEKRVCILTRSAFAGSQRYASTIWSGDISGEWSSLKASIPAGLSLALSGIPYWTTDIGGFWVRHDGGNQNEEYRELFTRWYQYGTFCPIFRVHGSSTEREMWYFGNEDVKSYKTQLKFNQLRYRLMPYIYSLARKVTHEHYTIMRALVMDFATDKKVLNIDDQFMFGPAFMVNPVTDYQATQRKVYLPGTNGWYDFWTGEYFDGDQEINAPAPFESMPLYVKSGSIIPMGPNVQYVNEKKADPIEIRVYTGSDGSFDLYEDEGDNYEYEKGAYSTISFNWSEASQTLTIGERQGEFPGMLVNRTFRIVFVDKQKGANHELSNQADSTIEYKGKETTIRK